MYLNGPYEWRKTQPSIFWETNRLSRIKIEENINQPVIE